MTHFIHLTRLVCYRTMPPRKYTSPVSDDTIVAVFDANRYTQHKATTVLRLLGLRRSRQRIINAHLRRLARPPYNRLVEVSPPVIAVHRNPFYSLATAAVPTPAGPSLTPDALITSNDTTTNNTPSPLLLQLPPQAPRANNDYRCTEAERFLPLTTADADGQDDRVVVKIVPSLQPSSLPSPHPLPSRPPCSVCHSADAPAAPKVEDAADITRDDESSPQTGAEDHYRSHEAEPITTADDDNRYDSDTVREINQSLLFQGPSLPSPHPPPSRPPCSICHSADATVVFLPCKHQLSCPPCWESAKKRQLSVHNRKERVRMELADAGARRVLFQPRCLWCQQGVQDEIHPFIS